MDREAQLMDLPFSYAAEVTSEEFGSEDFLLKNKLVGGYWSRWSLLVRPARFKLPLAAEQPRDPSSHWRAGHRDAYGPLKQEAAILLCGSATLRPPGPNKPLVSWLQYFEWRGLSLSSPVAPLLSSALSVYYIITSLVPKHFPELNILKKQSLKIHIVESHREFHTLLTFWELSVLLPHVTFELVFIGEGLPSWSDGQQLFMLMKNGSVSLVDLSLTPNEKASKKGITVKCYHRAYHMLQGPKPDLVIGFKPAIPLHESWLSTLPRLQSLKVPAYFCELSELSCECSQQVMNQATGGTVSSPVINPFHCPLRISGGDNRLPWYSNGFIFHLMYKPAVNFQRPAAANIPDPLPIKPASPSPEPPKLTRKERKAAARNLPRKRR
ncbi:zinc finger MYND domain-containing protein 15-like [Centroberyx affinis]|uniref:zinc finger MYND domain-containing protein 15-like n=1 Tax=Centroberyx affinis TaxID=166261 RepID=UPI003A5C60DC